MTDVIDKLGGSTKNEGDLDKETSALDHRGCDRSARGGEHRVGPTAPGPARGTSEPKGAPVQKSPTGTSGQAPAESKAKDVQQPDAPK